ncbi:LOB domain-containing protein [Drosera capensis]
MSCNGCRILRKGCSETCILRPCLQWIKSPEAQSHATVFVAKFFGRAGLMSFISNVPANQSPALFQSLLYEACGRTVNPVNGAVGLLWTGNWHVCQAAVETVLRGGTLRPIPELLNGIGGNPDSDEASEVFSAKNKDDNILFGLTDLKSSVGKAQKQKRSPKAQSESLDLSLAPPMMQQQMRFGDSRGDGDSKRRRRDMSPSRNSEEGSAMTRESFESGLVAETIPAPATTLMLFM